jgi:hypothetical protein
MRGPQRKRDVAPLPLWLKHFSAADSVLPSPLWGGWRASRQACATCASLAALRAGWGSCSDPRVSPQTWTPTPIPSPQGGGEQTEFAARDSTTNEHSLGPHHPTATESNRGLPAAFQGLAWVGSIKAIQGDRFANLSPRHHWAAKGISASGKPGRDRGQLCISCTDAL